MDERNRQHIHDQSDDAAEAPVRTDGSTLRPGALRPSTLRPGAATGATSRAFVVELTSGVADTEAFSGRVQHLTTFDGGNFNSAESLVAIIRRVLERVQRKQFDK